MKKLIMLSFFFVLFLCIGAEPKQVGVSRKTTQLTISRAKDNVKKPELEFKAIEFEMEVEESDVFVEVVYNRNVIAPPVNFKCVVVKPKFRVQSARQNVDDGNQIFA